MILKSDFINLSSMHVHFVDNIEIDFEVDDLKIMEACIDHIKCDKDMFSVIEKAMRFPDYFGKNWDAFDECIGDLEWMPANGYFLILKGASKAFQNTPETLRKLIVSWLEAAEYWAEDKKAFHLIFCLNV